MKLKIKLGFGARLGVTSTLMLCGTQLTSAAQFDCVIEPQQVIEMRSPMEGLIDRVLVDRGDPVTMGQELVILDTSIERIQSAIARQRSEMEGPLRTGQARLDYSSAKVQRTQELHGQNFLSAQARDEALTERRLAEAELQEALDNRKLAALELQRQSEIIRMKSVRSPVNGVVMERLLNPGELTESGVGRKPLLKLAQIDPLRVEVVLPAEAYGKVNLNSMIEVSPEIPGPVSYKARVKVIDRVLDAASGTFGVRLQLPNPGGRIPAGVRCKANFPGIEPSASALARTGARR